MADVFGDAVEHHLHGQEDEQGAHEAGEGGGAFLAHEVKKLAGYGQEKGRGDPCQNDGKEALELLRGGGAEGGLHHDQGDGGRPHDDGYGDGNDEQLGLAVVLVRASLGGEYHAYGNDEEHDAAAEVERAAADAHPPQQLFTQEEKEEQEQEYKAEFPHQNAVPARFRYLLQQAFEHGRIPRRVHYQKEGSCCGDDVVPVHGEAAQAYPFSGLLSITLCVYTRVVGRWLVN